jgi:hypothetical protein
MIIVNDIKGRMVGPIIVRNWTGKCPSAESTYRLPINSIPRVGIKVGPKSKGSPPRKVSINLFYKQTFFTVFLLRSTWLRPTSSRPLRPTSVKSKTIWWSWNQSPTAISSKGDCFPMFTFKLDYRRHTLRNIKRIRPWPQDTKDLGTSWYLRTITIGEALGSSITLLCDTT